MEIWGVKGLNACDTFRTVLFMQNVLKNACYNYSRMC